MATSRKRSSGFEETPEEKTLENFGDFEEMLESIQEIIEAEGKAEPPVIKSAPFVEESIVPMQDFGPRFLKEEEEKTQVSPEPKKEPALSPAPKRQPRNLPKFSRIR